LRRGFSKRASKTTSDMPAMVIAARIATLF
jgi:hypothetical protein